MSLSKKGEEGGGRKKLSACRNGTVSERKTTSAGKYLKKRAIGGRLLPSVPDTDKEMKIIAVLALGGGGETQNASLLRFSSVPAH